MDWPLAGRAREMVRFREALRDRGSRGVVLVGPAGVGKTRLAQEYLDLCAARGWHCAWAVGTRSAASIPFGAFAHLLPATLPDTRERLELLQCGRAAIVAKAAESGRLALGVDDAHLLDEGSAALVHQLALDETAHVVCTVRAEERTPDPIVALWKDEIAQRVEVGALSPESVRRLVEITLVDSVHAATINELWRLSQGHPLLLRELLLGGMETGALVRADKLWTHTSSLASMERLHELIEARLERLSETERELLDVIACGEPLDLHLLAEFGDQDVVDTLERAYLITVVQDQQRCTVRAAHPLYAEVVNAVMPRARRRAITRRLADLLEATGHRRRGDLLRLGRCRLQGGGRSDPTVLLAAARQAHGVFDHALAELLARASMGQGGGTDAALVLGRAISAQGRADEAERLLAALTDKVETDQERVQLASARAENLLFHTATPEAVAVLEVALDEVVDDRWRSELDAMVVFQAAYLGDLSKALARGQRLLARDDATPSAVLRTLVIYTYVKALAGRLTGLEAEIDRGLELASELREAFPLAEDLLTVNRQVALMLDGQLLATERLARARYRQAIEKQARDVLGLWATNVAYALTVRGKVAEAAPYHAEGVSSLRDRDPVDMLLLALSIQAYTSAIRGRRKTTRGILAECRRLTPDWSPVFGGVWAGRARAWLIALEGATSVAAEQARQVGQDAAEQHHRFWGGLALHDAVRMGHPKGVAEPLRELADRSEGSLIAALSDHAEALAEEDAAALAETANTFASLGADLYAAEAVAQAAVLHDRSDDAMMAQQCRARALLLTEHCREAQTPWLWITEDDRLTQRQLQVATMAARGLSDREISDRLGISVRTVNNHLAATYTKLGVTGRRELADVLAAFAPDAPSGSP